MEVSLLEADIPEGCLLSVRAGTTRRQAPAGQTNKPCKLAFPRGVKFANPFKVDLLAPLGSAEVEVWPGNEEYPIEVQPKHGGKPFRMTLRLQDDGQSRFEPKAEIRGQDPISWAKDQGSPVPEHTAARRHQMALEARNYLDEHDLLNWVQDLLQDLIHDRPGDPWGYIDSRTAQMRKLAAGRPSSPQKPSQQEAPALSRPQDAEATLLPPVVGGDSSAVAPAGALKEEPKKTPPFATYYSEHFRGCKLVELAAGRLFPRAPSAAEPPPPRQRAQPEEVPGGQKASPAPMPEARPVQEAAAAVPEGQEATPAAAAPSVQEKAPAPAGPEASKVPAAEAPPLQEASPVPVAEAPPVQEASPVPVAEAPPVQEAPPSAVEDRPAAEAAATAEGTSPAVEAASPVEEGGGAEAAAARPVEARSYNFRPSVGSWLTVRLRLDTEEPQPSAAPAAQPPEVATPAEAASMEPPTAVGPKPAGDGTAAAAPKAVSIDPPTVGAKPAGDDTAAAAPKVVGESTALFSQRPSVGSWLVFRSWRKTDGTASPPEAVASPGNPASASGAVVEPASSGGGVEERQLPAEPPSGVAESAEVEHGRLQRSRFESEIEALRRENERLRQLREVHVAATQLSDENDRLKLQLGKYLSLSTKP